MRCVLHITISVVDVCYNLDPQDTFIMQTHGSKQWLVYNKFFELPSDEQAVFDLTAADVEGVGTPIANITLFEGDVLYIPRGVVHRVQSLAGNNSQHLTIGLLNYDR